MALPTTMRSGIDELMQLRSRENMPSDMQQQLRTREEEEASARRDMEQATLKGERLGATRKGQIEKIGKREKEIVEEQAKKLEDIYGDVDHQTQVGYFTPTKTSGSDLMGLFSMLTAVAFMSGGKGRYSGTSAMNSMASALEGWNQGRNDLFKKEVIEFDKNMKSLQEHNRMIEQKLKNALEMWKVNREAALGEIAELKALEAGSALQQDLNKGDLDRAFKRATEARQAADKINEDWRGMVGKAFEIEKQRIAAENADTRQQKKFEHDLELLAKRLEAKGGEGAFRKRTKQDEDSYFARRIMMPELDRAESIVEKLKNSKLWPLFTFSKGFDPRLAEAVFSQDPKLPPEHPDNVLRKEAVELVRILSKFRGKEFETAGKALTAREDLILRPLYSGDFRTADAMRNAIRQGRREMELQTKLQQLTVEGLQQLEPLVSGVIGAGSSAEPAAPAPAPSVAPTSSIPPEVQNFLKDQPEGSGTNFRGKTYRKRKGQIVEATK